MITGNIIKGLFKEFVLLMFLSLLLSCQILGQEDVVQDPKFGGPFTVVSFNNYGPSLSVGGGGTFLTNGNFYIGVFGQGTTDAFKRVVVLDDQNYLMKSRQTGFWLGYYHRFKSVPGTSISLYNKTGFGSVRLDDPEKSVNFYDATIIFTPNVELAMQIASFFEIGLAVYYEIFTGVSLFNYRNADFNASGISLLFKFKGVD